MLHISIIFFSLGYDWSQGLDYEKLLQSYLTAGFQATSFGLAVQEVNKMVITNLC